MSARLTPVAIAQLLKQTSATCVLINSQVSRTSEEALELLQADVDAPVIPNFLGALNFEELLSPNVPLYQTKIPPRYTAWVREDLDALIMHSSGTTGLPKPIYHSQGYPLIYAAAHRLPEQKDPFRFNVSTLPLYHVSVVKTSARSTSDVSYPGLWSIGADAVSVDWHALHPTTSICDSDWKVYTECSADEWSTLLVHRPFCCRRGFGTS